MPTLRPPEAIFLFSTPIVRNIARRVSAMFNHSIFRRMYWWKVGRFFRDAGVRNQFVPLLYRQFDAAPVGAVRAGTITAPKLKEFKRPVRIIFGASDPYLNRGVAQKFHQLFPNSDLFLLCTARHFVQMDEPEEVARLILSASANGSEKK
jgi:pimeloyl-ACP methyl ester carboxylesterase